MMALSYVGVSQLFVEALWPRVLALVSGVWGVSALVGPLVGGAFASAGLWRGAFWAFAAQGLLVVALAPVLIGAGLAPSANRPVLPGRQIVALTIGVLAVSAAGVQAEAPMTVALAALGLAALLLVLRLETTAPERLFPPRPLSANVPWGPGYVMVLTLATATVSFTVYGPLLMAKLFGTTPIVAGFMVASESLAWTVTAIVFARAPAAQEAALIRFGAILIACGVAGLAFAMPRGPVWALLPWAGLQGAGFGMCWAFLLRRIVAAVPAGERERASAAMPTFQMIGYAVGAAASGIVANALGLVDGARVEVVRAVAFWVFAAFLPLAPIGIAAAFRLTARRA
jgi:MFS family permease